MCTNRERSIIVSKGGRYWIYTNLFRKQNRNNIDEAQLAAFHKLATEFVGVSDETLSKLLKKKLCEVGVQRETSEWNGAQALHVARKRGLAALA
jgi:hypothetical protein